jgi:flagellar basal-body rod modification protein FlgD
MTSNISAINNLAQTDGGKDKPHDLKDLDVNQFLQLMISELTNQDPLNPMDNTQLVQQISTIREISATTQLSDTLNSVQSGQSLATASSLIGKSVTALTDEGGDVTGVVDRVTVSIDEEKNTRSYRIHIGENEADLKNVREITPTEV